MLEPTCLRRAALRSALACALLGWGGAASAVDLSQAYLAALQNDPNYRAARYENEAGRESVAIGRAGLLPNISGSVSRSRNRVDLLSSNGFGLPTQTHPQYRSESSSVTLRQPIFSLDALARYRQTVAQSAYSDIQFKGRTEELILRVVGAYLDALYTDDQLALARGQREVYAEQKRVNDRLLARGEGTRTDALETQAKLDLAEAQLLELTDARSDAREALAAIIGRDPGELVRLASDFGDVALTSGTFDDWKAAALKRNSEISAQAKAVDIARYEISKSQAGHAPRLDVVAIYSKSLSETINTLGQDSTTRTIGLQLSVPLYSGGAVNASSRQAVAGMQRAEAELDARTGKVLLDLRKQYNLMITGKAHIDALRKSVESGKLLIEATTNSIKGGVRINLDLLNAQQQQFTALRDLAQTRYSYLLSYLRLRSAAGQLNGDDVKTVAAYFR